MPQEQEKPREIPFNYTSASDRQAVAFLLGEPAARRIDELRERRVTGRSARLLNRIFGEVLVHRRNPYLMQELLDSTARRRRFFDAAMADLERIEGGAGGDETVLALVAEVRQLLSGFKDELARLPGLRARMRRELGAAAGEHNVLFDPFTLVAHATDATDWRLYLPLAVVTPEREQDVAPTLAAIEKLGLRAIARGGGTGLTGGAVPLKPGCVIVNTEKLNRIRAIAPEWFEAAEGGAREAQVMELEAGVITEDAMKSAEQQGLVFATDPTSAWASTIGGNIAENAGGKKAVRWGVCIDNLLSWRMSLPGGRRWRIERVGHPLRKILPGDRVRFVIADEASGEMLQSIELASDEIRRKGLWKDITNKALGGVPGLQKEGVDGVITSARFVLHEGYKHLRTVCLEFFGPDMDEASRVIVELAREFPLPQNGEAALLALEHFDDEYIRAIGYKVKAARAETPKAALLIDVGGDAAESVEEGLARLRRVLEPHKNTLLFAARNQEEAARFWADRKKLGAIARRTNAFKLNEDIVIPLEKLAEFARFVEQTNQAEERQSQQEFARKAWELIAARAEEEELGEKLPAVEELTSRFLRDASAAEGRALRSLTLLSELRRALDELLQGCPQLLEELEKLHQTTRNRRIVLATHMHAGDGNVHVNVPVLSNDRRMLDHAGEVIDRVMERVVALGGSVSGEHGVGVTKLKYLPPARIAELRAHRARLDPTGLMNPGKLEELADIEHIFTPSFNLLELEARILQHGQLEGLSRQIAHCVRCGKCKGDCCVFYPARGMFYHPRNKNLAIGSLIEALLYDAQRERSTRFELLEWLEEVADHCTICHKCLKPCPVDIDTGAVSVLEREILANWGYKHTPLATKMTLGYLDSRSPLYNKGFRAAVLRLGGAAQRAASVVAAPLQPRDRPSDFYPLRLLRSSMPPTPSTTLRDVLPDCDGDHALVLEPYVKAAPGAATPSAFYFPGCGSERMFSQVSMASIHLMLRAGARVVLPPPFLCCGFPAQANAKRDMRSQMQLRNTILFSQIREMFSYLDFRACVVSCGTCREGLLGMKAERLFGGRVIDVSAFVAELGLRLGGDERVLYHAPCHDSLQGRAVQTLGAIGGFAEIKPSPHCCSEAGTLALSRPDISDAMLDRKRRSIAEAMGDEKRATLLTNCPSCLQGLGRNRALGAEAEHIAVHLARRLDGEHWREIFARHAAQATPTPF